MSDVLASYEKTTFTHDGKTREIFRKGSGPAVIIIAEMPGITPKVVEFADRVVAIGCTAVLPHLFGEPGRDVYSKGPAKSPPSEILFSARTIVSACISREFTVLATGRTSPVIDWLKALARHEHERCGGPGVGAVGMCFTGNFALGMVVDPSVVAPVLSQPSLPFPVTAKHKHDLAVSDADLAAVKQRCETENLCVMGLRFTHDRVVPAERFERLRQELGDNFVGIELDSSPGNPHGHPKVAHAVLTEHLVDEPGTPTRDALDRVLDFYRERLLTA